MRMANGPIIFTYDDESEAYRSSLQYIQKEKQSETFLYTKRPTLFKKHDNLRNVFIYKNPDTLRYAVFHEIFETGICIQKP